jgi:hypothetical protein
MVVLTACRLDAAVDVVVEDDGRGTVEVAATLDPDAMERIGGDLSAVLEADDLEAAGWEVSTSEPTEVRLRRPFEDPAEANAILAGLSGPDGPLRGLAVAEDTSFARTEWSFDGTIDLSAGIAAFGDAALAEVLDGEAVGLSEAELEAELGHPLSEALGVAVSVRLPDDDGVQASWSADYGDPPVTMEATGIEERPETWVAVAVGAASALLLLVLGLRGLRSRRRARQGRRAAHLADDGST